LKEIIIAPIVHRIQGQDVTIASFIIPIVQDGKFYGIAGVDAPIGVMQELVNNINLYEGTTDVTLFTEKGTIIAVRQRPEMANQPISNIYPDYGQIQSELSATFSRISMDGQYLQIFAPIEVDEGGTRWVLGLSIPFEKITAPATNAAIRQFTISLTFILLALVFLWFLARQIVRPLQTLTDAARAVSQGDLTATADVHSNDEVEALANTFNSMTSQLRTWFATLEQRVSERTAELSATSQQNEKRARNLQTINEIGEAISNEQGLEKLLPLITNVVSERFGFYHVGIFMLDTASNFAVLRAANSPGGQRMLKRDHRLEIGQVGIVGKVAASGKPRIALNVGEDAVYFNNPDLPETRSEIALPMTVSGGIIGVLDVQSVESNAFTNEDVHTLSILSNQIAIAIENARLLETTRKSLAETETVYRQYLQREWSRFSTEEKLAGFQYVDGTSTPLKVPLDLGQIAQDVRDGNIHQVEAGRNGKSAQLAIPVKLRGEVIGILHISTPQKTRWADDDIDIAEAVAERLALSMENARLLQSSANRATRERIVSDISSKISGNIRMENILQTTAKELSQALGGSDVLIQLQVPKQASEEQA
jgi:GAF domain-containing protein/HAMP domain-containing protein